MGSIATINTLTGRDYAGIRTALINHIKETHPKLYSDFTDANLGSLLVDLMAGVGDIVSYGIDAASAEVLLATCRRHESALNFARSVGYVPRPYTAATATMSSIGTLPSAAATYGGMIKKGQAITGGNGLRYEVTEDTYFSAGMTSVKVNVTEGSSFTETFQPVNRRNYAVTTLSPKVASGSWRVFVGDATDPDNEWEEVPLVTLETTASKTYSVSFDTEGRAIILFGDNTAGAIPQAVITVTYRTCNGARGNVAAKSISGSLKLDIAAPGTGTQAVEFENYEEVQTTVGGVTPQYNEAVGLTNGAASMTFVLAHAPLSAGQVQIMLAPPGSGDGAGIVVVHDDGAGGLVEVSNTTGRTLVTGSVGYTSGAVALTFSGSLNANGAVTADYYFFTSPDPADVTISGAASGGDDRETLEELRANIPAYIRSQDRLITQQDYQEGISRVAAVELAYADTWSSVYNGNVVRLYAWAKETGTALATSKEGISVEVPYARFTRISDTIVRSIQNFIKPRSLLTVHHVIERPSVAWVDVYLGTVGYDHRLSAADVRKRIAEAVVAAFESFGGFSVKLAEVYNAVRDVAGVVQFNIERLTLGSKDTTDVPESQGATSGTASISGTLTTLPVSPGSVLITVEQGGYNIKIVDDAAGGFTVQSGGVTLASGSINYATGAWTVTFSAPLVGSQPYYAVYRDVMFDYRREQVMAVTDDQWPPAGLGSVPYQDGVPTVPGTPNQYAPLQDIDLTPESGETHYYDETFIYNDEILYNSVDVNGNDIRAINLRKLVFSLLPR